MRLSVTYLSLELDRFGYLCRRKGSLQEPAPPRYPWTTLLQSGHPVVGSHQLWKPTHLPSIAAALSDSTSRFQSQTRHAFVWDSVPDRNDEEFQVSYSQEAA